MKMIIENFDEIVDRLRQNWRNFFQFLTYSRKIKITFYILLLLLPLLTFGYAVLLPLFYPPIPRELQTIAQEEKINSYRLAQSAEQLEIRSLAAKHSQLRLDEAYYQAQTSAAKSDSITLLLKLPDSLAVLQIKGVAVRQCKISDFRISRAVHHMRQAGILPDWIRSPFTSINSLSTIPKNSYRIKQAPKDTVEANQTREEMVAPREVDVYFTYQFDRDLKLVVHQIERPTLVGSLIWAGYRLQFWWDLVKETWRNLLKLERPHHRIQIELALSRSDVKAIYRALPRNTLLVLRP